MADRPSPTTDTILVAPNAERLLIHPAPAIDVRPPNPPQLEPLVQEFPFVGAWLPGPDPLVIGPRNYTVLQNLHYRDGELQSVLGYSKITTTPHATYVKGRSGIQFYKTINAQPLNILLVQAYNIVMTASAVLAHVPAIPQVGDFNATPLHVDAPGAGLGRFALAPNQQIAYANGREAMIWAGEQHRVAAFLLVNSAGTTVRDSTEAVANVLQDSQNIALIHDGANTPYILIGTTRPASGFSLNIQTPNTTSLALTAFYWGASGWTPVTGLVDTTALAGVPLAQSGSITFDDTQLLARVKFDHDRVFYWYQLRFSGPTSGGTSVYYATARLPFQPVRDIWDGNYREPIMFQLFKDNKYQDYTLDILEAEASASSFNAPLSVIEPGDPDPTNNPFTTADYVLIGFTQPTMAIKWRMADKRINGNATTATVQYWDGAGWATVTNFLDGTRDPGATVSITRSGTMSWTPPAPGIEFAQTLFGVTGYFYKVFWSADLSNEVNVDQIQGIPGPRLLHGAVFPFHFQSRLFWMGDILANEGHKAEYSATNAPDVYNGEDTSSDGKAIFVGSGGTLSAAVEIYNRFAGSLAYLGVIGKDDETWVLSGNSPDSFQLFPVSKTIGMPAPLTLCSAEVAYSVAEDAQRNIALWLSHEGPVAFDGSVIKPLSGLEPYFDLTDPRRINPAAIANARGWYDHERREYHLLVPSGASQVICNAWLVLDLQRQRWSERVPPTYPQLVFPVKDLPGAHYSYGHLDTGHLMRLDSGYTWDGAGITQVVETAEILPSNQTMEETLLRYLRLIVVRGSGSAANVSLTHYADGSLTGHALNPVGVTSGSGRLVRVLQGTNRRATSHRLRFSLTTTDQQVTWLLWGGWFERVRQHGG